jgi:hypothetical protein
MVDPTPFVLDVTRRLAGADAWLDRALGSARRPAAPAFRAAYASIPRRLAACAGEAVAPPAELRAFARPHWTATDWVRLALVEHALSGLPAAEHASLVAQVFEGGELGEQESLLRTLLLLPEPERFVETAIQACRMHTVRVFAAIACENAYPARFFPALNFNQMVLKSIFIEVSVRRIESLASRVTPELARMVEGYASERRAAGRPVPADADFILQGAHE